MQASGRPAGAIGSAGFVPCFARAADVRASFRVASPGRASEPLTEAGSEGRKKQSSGGRCPTSVQPPGCALRLAEAEEPGHQIGRDQHVDPISISDNGAANARPGPIGGFRAVQFVPVCGHRPRDTAGGVHR